MPLEPQYFPWLTYVTRARTHRREEILDRVLNTHTFHSQPVGTCRLYDSSHSTHTDFSVAACPLTPAASKIEKRPCADSTPICSCWLRTFGRLPKTLTRWAGELQKYELQALPWIRVFLKGMLVTQSVLSEKKLASLLKRGLEELLLRNPRTNPRQETVVLPPVTLWVSYSYIS